MKNDGNNSFNMKSRDSNFHILIHLILNLTKKSTNKYIIILNKNLERPSS